MNQPITSYDYLRAYTQVIAQLEETSGVLTEESQALLNATLDGIGGKIEGLCYFVSSIDAEADHFDAWADRLAQRAKVLRNTRDRIKSGIIQPILESHFDLTGEKKIPAGTVTVYLKQSEYVDGPEDAESWPEEYRRTKVTADKAGALKALKAGQQIPGVTLGVSNSVSWR